MEDLTSYDQVPYETTSFPETHPDSIATIGTLFGLETANVEACRVLELGCARGENLIPLGAALPRSTFIGVDLSRNQIEYGKKTIHSLGLRNVELRHMSITEITPSLGEFDYIITHGIYSWVPKQVQHGILRVSRENLAPNGIAYISYNTYPGWHMRRIIRDVMLYHCKRFSDPARYIEQGRAFLDFVAQSIKGANTPYSLLLERELSGIKQMPDWYVFHDYLEQVNEPIYFHEFAELASASGLQYLSDVPVSTMLIDKFPQKIRDTLKQLAPDIIRMEQYKDFLCNRTFRRSLLCRPEIRIRRTITPESILKLYVAAPLRPLNPALNVSSLDEEEFQKPSGQSIKIKNPFIKAVFLHLSAIWPSWCAFEDLLEAGRAIVGVHVDTAAEAKRLSASLLKLYFDELVEFHAYPSPFSLDVKERPSVISLARFQAKRGDKVTNLRHEPIMLEASLREMIGFVDGSRDKIELIKIVAGMEGAGLFSNPTSQKPEEILKGLLGGMAKNALLIP